MKHKTAFILLLLSAFCLSLILFGGLSYFQSALETDFSRKNLPPSLLHLFGTDWMGRDMFSRTAAGLSLSIRVGLISSTISAVIAFALGTAAATGGKFADAFITWLIDLFMGIPHILLLILISFACGRGFRGVLIGLALTHWMTLTRLIRMEILQLRQSGYIQSAEKLGASRLRIAFVHILPHLLPQFAAGLIVLFPHAILHEASVTFLGFGLPPEQPAIGMILSESLRYLIGGSWWLAVLPGISLVATILLFDTLGGALRALITPIETNRAGSKRTSRVWPEFSRTPNYRSLIQPGESNMPVLEIKNLSISFSRYTGLFTKTNISPIAEFSLEVHAGEVVSIVGASGSGKSLLAHSIFGLLPSNASCGGKIFYHGEELTETRKENLRGKEIALVPQNVSYLDPLMKVGPQIRMGARGKEAKSKSRAVLSRYGLDEATENLYPFELSGGMARRILISTAVIQNPRLVIADEPTPGLHISVAKRVLGHFREMAEGGAAVLLITHELELAAAFSDRVYVLYDGHCIEEVRASDFSDADKLRHPYTKALWHAMPQNGFEV